MNPASRPAALFLALCAPILLARPALATQAGEAGEAPKQAAERLDDGLADAKGKTAVFVRFADQLFQGAGDYERFCAERAKDKRSALRAEVLATLRKKHDATMKRVGPKLAALEKEGAIEAGQPYWIVNGYACLATPEGLRALAALDGVDFVYRQRAAPQHRTVAGRFGRRRTTPQEALAEFEKKHHPGPTEPMDAAALAKLEVPWNLERIDAPSAWKQGYQGQGVVVALLDTGLLDTPALTGALWRNPKEQPDGKDDDGNGYVDDVHGWNFMNDEPFVPGSESPRMPHGSICAGIVAGRPHPGKPLITGVAPRARLMVLQGMGSLRAYEYALANGADVMSMSYMWVRMELGNYRAVFRLAHEHLAAAGVLSVGGAGNFGSGGRQQAPKGEQIALPKDIPCVLAAAGIVEDGSRPKASSEGPVTWTGVRGYDDYPAEAPLLKPDLTACFGGYPVWCLTTIGRRALQPVFDAKDGCGLVVGPQGNSFSGPHVAGVAALLWSAAPELQVAELSRILCESAKDLGEEGPDMSYGHGLLQAGAAIALLLAEHPEVREAEAAKDDAGGAPAEEGRR
ncbi:MAG: S8 family serine peptidase [Planctomycetota bacterium]